MVSELRGEQGGGEDDVGLRAAWGVVWVSLGGSVLYL